MSATNPNLLPFWVPFSPTINRRRWKKCARAMLDEQVRRRVEETARFTKPAPRYNWADLAADYRRNFPNDLPKGKS